MYIASSLRYVITSYLQSYNIILPRSQWIPQGVQVVPLDEVEQHLNWCHTEVVWPHVKDRQSEKIHLLSHWNPSVIAGIIQNDDG